MTELNDVPPAALYDRKKHELMEKIRWLFITPVEELLTREIKQYDKGGFRAEWFRAVYALSYIVIFPFDGGRKRKMVCLASNADTSCQFYDENYYHMMQVEQDMNRPTMVIEDSLRLFSSQTKNHKVHKVYDTIGYNPNGRTPQENTLNMAVVSDCSYLVQETDGMKQLGKNVNLTDDATRLEILFV